MWLLQRSKKKREQVTLVGPQSTVIFKKKKRKKKKEFKFTENIDEHWIKILQEVRFRAITRSSSFVGNIRYDQDLQEMTMILNGIEYTFCNVPERKFEVLQGATSVGAAFNREIKGQHDC